MKKKILFGGIIIFVVAIIAVVSIALFGNKEYEIVTIKDSNDRKDVKSVKEILKNDNEIEKVVFDTDNVFLSNEDFTYENDVEFLIGSDSYLYVIEKDLDLEQVNIPGTDLKGYKTSINNLADLFYCSAVSQSAEHTLYALDKDGKLYFITSSFALDLKGLKLTEMKYKNIIDVYSREECDDEELCWIDNYARDINGKEYSIVDDYEEFYNGF